MTIAKTERSILRVFMSPFLNWTMDVFACHGLHSPPSAPNTNWLRVTPMDTTTCPVLRSAHTFFLARRLCIAFVTAL